VVNEFTIVDLSALYLDVLKDRMYTFAPTSVERRSAQTVIWKITEALVRLVAPILAFTADEVWSYLPQVEGREASVHLAEFPKPEAIAAKDDSLLADWKTLLEIRDEALKKLEIERKAGRIGKALEAKNNSEHGRRKSCTVAKVRGVAKGTFECFASRVDRRRRRTRRDHAARRWAEVQPLLELPNRHRPIRPVGQRLRTLRRGP
jgi:isoleucyl-tRNA synthetase